MIALRESMSKLITSTIEKIGPLDEMVMREARDKQNGLTKPPGSLGRLEELSVQLAGPNILCPINIRL